MTAENAANPAQPAAAPLIPAMKMWKDEMDFKIIGQRYKKNISLLPRAPKVPPVIQPAASPLYMSCLARY
jgi:hypothetical protein